VTWVSQESNSSEGGNYDDMMMGMMGSGKLEVDHTEFFGDFDDDFDKDNLE
jgi:hypothetical protein